LRNREGSAQREAPMDEENPAHPDKGKKYSIQKGEEELWTTEVQGTPTEDWRRANDSCHQTNTRREEEISHWLLTSETVKTCDQKKKKKKTEHLKQEYTVRVL
jgi:1,2-phenylacetyl-CoA epoxidase PaaB subunit